jgi:hypothetical protein
MLKEAQEYSRLGLSVIPVRPHDKKPLVTWEPYQNLKASPDTILYWWTKWPEANIGIVTGRISGIVVVDCDSKEGLGNINEYLRQSIIGKIPTVSTGNGFHLYFKHPNKGFINNRGSMFEAVDVRGDGGYVIAPPSIHPSGKRYAWASTVRLPSLPDIPPELLNAILTAPPATKKSEAPRKKASTTEGQWFEQSDSDPDVRYRVRLMSSGYWNCECDGYVKGHHECKHIKRRKAALEKEKKK